MCVCVCVCVCASRGCEVKPTVAAKLLEAPEHVPVVLYALDDVELHLLLRLEEVVRGGVRLSANFPIRQVVEGRDFRAFPFDCAHGQH